MGTYTYISYLHTGTHSVRLDFLPSGLLGEHGHIRDDEALKLGSLREIVAG